MQEKRAKLGQRQERVLLMMMNDKVLGDMILSRS